MFVLTRVCACVCLRGCPCGRSASGGGERVEEGMGRAGREGEGGRGMGGEGEGGKGRG